MVTNLKSGKQVNKIIVPKVFSNTKLLLQKEAKGYTESSVVSDEVGEKENLIDQNMHVSPIP